MDSPSISDQFDEWYMTESRDYPDITITHMKVISCRNASKQHVETMFIVYEYEVTVKIK